MTHQQIADMGEDARRVIENPAFNEALRLMAEDAIERLKECPMRDHEGRLLLAQAARLTDKVAETLRGLLEAGKMAAAQIEIDSARSESRVKRALNRVL